MTAMLYCGDGRDVLASMPDQSVQCCVTSPPYWGLRSYITEGDPRKVHELGTERTPEEYVANMVAVFREVRRVLRDDGVMWLNLGDSYCSTDKWGGGKNGNNGKHTKSDDGSVPSWAVRERKEPITGLKPKDLVGIPWLVAFALRADGWYLRSDVIWAKPNPMPESVTDRPTKSHEYLFLLTRSATYYYDAAAIAEEAHRTRDGFRRGVTVGPTRNARSVWTIVTQPYLDKYFATFPEELARRCILSGSRPGDTVLDPFAGSGTTAAVAVGNARRAIHIDLNPAYIELARQRIGPMLCEVA